MNTTPTEPTPQEDRIELDSILSDVLRVPPPPAPSIAPWDEDRATPRELAGTMRPRAPRRTLVRTLQALAAIGLGVVVAAALSTRGSESAQTAELVAADDAPPPPVEPESDATPASAPAALPSVERVTIETTLARPSAVERTPAVRRAHDSDERRPAASESSHEAERLPHTTPTDAPAPTAVSTEPAVTRSEPPTRDEVRTAMENVRARVETCAAGRHGRADVQITVSPSGRVQGALVQGSFGGSPEGSCIARTARTARFPAFQGAPFSVLYPYSL